MVKKVLIIEDDPALRKSIEQMLELENLEPIATNGFTQARRSIRSNFRGVILSDIKMPDYSGFDVLQFANGRDTDLPVILLTGHSDIPTAMRAMKDGAYDYLEKPCNPPHLIETLRRALDHRALVLENRYVREGLSKSQMDDESGTLTERLERYERKIIKNSLSAEHGKVSEVAQKLGIAQNTLYDRMAKLKIVAKAFRE